MLVEQLKYYLDRYTGGAITPAEWAELRQILLDPDNETALDEVLDGQLAELADKAIEYPGLVERIQSRLSGQLSLETGQPSITARPVHRIHFLRKWGSAAAVILLIGAGIIFFVTSGRRSVRPETRLPKSIIRSTVIPGGSKAILTLADGAKIVLDSAANGAVADQGNTSVVKTSNGEIRYRPNNSRQNAVAWNTMSTPKGGQYQLTLSDGTKVWLNAASSIRYPASFTGNDRTVEVTGEAYFEVTTDPHSPFHVKIKGGTEVEVLGTKFNVNAYDDEPGISATLLEGSVKVRTQKKSELLRPGQQATIHQSDILVNQHSDIDKVMAWKNGLFNFEDASLTDVMRQLTRWYDIEVRYEDVVPEIYFAGKMSRDLRLEDILGGLKGARVHFRLEGRTLVVLP
jgi:transmembrane sensor